MNTKTLLLTSSDLEHLIDEKDAFDAMREVFQAHALGQTQMPSKIYLDLPVYHGDLRAMPAHVESLKICGLKWVNAHPDNIRSGRYPAVMGTLILNDPKTGFPLAIMDGTRITRLRTGAAGALASFYLARPNSKILALIGCGVQAESQLLSHLKVFEFSEIRIWDLRIVEAQSFKKRMEPHFQKIRVCENVRDCIKDAEILCTTTPARGPVVFRPWINSGVHINAVGADAKGKQELDPTILKEAIIVVDEIDQALHGGELNVPYSQGLITEKNISATLGEIIAKKKMGRQKEKDITVFDSTGLAIQDIALGAKAYQKALQKGVGQQIQFI